MSEHRCLCVRRGAEGYRLADRECLSDRAKTLERPSIIGDVSIRKLETLGLLQAHYTAKSGPSAQNRDLIESHYVSIRELKILKRYS